MAFANGSQMSAPPDVAAVSTDGQMKHRAIAANVDDNDEPLVALGPAFADVVVDSDVKRKRAGLK